MVTGKANQYSAVVLSINAEVYKINMIKFEKKFILTIPDLKKIAIQRNIFIYERLKSQAKFHFM